MLERDITSPIPNQKWVTDVTESHLFGKKMYLSPVLGLCGRDIASYTISERPTLSMVTTMLEKTLEQIINNTKLIFHSDQGFHCQDKKYQRMIQKKDVCQSMSRIGDCLDNAIMEN